MLCKSSIGETDACVVSCQQKCEVTVQFLFFFKKYAEMNSHLSVYFIAKLHFLLVLLVCEVARWKLVGIKSNAQAATLKCAK